jgi:hypothetical protein
LTLGDIAPGDVITGSYTYNPQTKDADSSVEVGFYPHTQQPYGMQLDLGSFSVQTEPADADFQITITNNQNGSDNYQVTSFNNIGTEPGRGSKPSVGTSLIQRRAPCRTPPSSRPRQCCRRGNLPSSTS